MSLKALQHPSEVQFELADRFGAISQSYACAMRQIEAVLDSKKRLQVFDLEKQEVLACLQPQDLVLAHAVNASNSLHDLIKQAARITRQNGYFSLITTTYDSFPLAQAYLADFIASKSILSAAVGHHYKSRIRKTKIAVNQNDLLQAFKIHHFDVVAHQRLYLPILLKNIDELLKFGMESTWFLNSPLLPKPFLLRQMRKIFENMFEFPYEDVHVIDVVLGQRSQM